MEGIVSTKKPRINPFKKFSIENLWRRKAKVGKIKFTRDKLNKIILVDGRANFRIKL
jgi:hypothetical protein